MTTNRTNPSATTAGSTKPTNALTMTASWGDTVWGIDNILANAIIQNETITEEDLTDDTQDQKNATVNRLSFDRHWTLQLTFLTDKIGSNSELSGIAESGQVDFTYAGKKWFVNSINYNGSYNAKKSYTIQAERWFNYPAQGN